MLGLGRRIIIALIIVATAGLFFGVVSGCSTAEPEAPEIVIEDQMVPLAQFEPAFIIPVPDSPGLLKQSNDKAFIDYSNNRDGYVTVGFLESTDRVLKVLITVPDGEEYVYNINPGVTEVLPLTNGDGKYTISVHEHFEGNIFLDVLYTEIDVELSNEFVPFIRPNQYVSYCEESPVTKKATELSLENDTFIDIVDAVYNYVVDNISYDFELAEDVAFGYTPNLDSVLEQGSGICFDMAALTAAMLRSQGIPSKLVFGEYNDPNLDYTYHAWVKVFSEVDCMIGDNILFTGGTWNILDPTLAIILCLNEAAIKKNDGTVYDAMYYY